MTNNYQSNKKQILEWYAACYTVVDTALLLSFFFQFTLYESCDNIFEDAALHGKRSQTVSQSVVTHHHHYESTRSQSLIVDRIGDSFVYLYFLCATAQADWYSLISHNVPYDTNAGVLYCAYIK